MGKGTWRMNLSGSGKLVDGVQHFSQLQIPLGIAAKFSTRERLDFRFFYGVSYGRSGCVFSALVECGILILIDILCSFSSPSLSVCVWVFRARQCKGVWRLCRKSKEHNSVGRRGKKFQVFFSSSLLRSGSAYRVGRAFRFPILLYTLMGWGIALAFCCGHFSFWEIEEWVLGTVMGMGMALVVQVDGGMFV